MATLCMVSELERKADKTTEVVMDEEEEREDEEERVDDENERTNDAEPECVPSNTEEEESDNKEDGEIPKKSNKAWEPSFYSPSTSEKYHFAGHSINIRESIDSYGAIIWPGAVALCQYLENNRQQVNLMDKSVLELGAGTGLVSIVACLLGHKGRMVYKDKEVKRPAEYLGNGVHVWSIGAWVTATDLPDVLGNLKCNLSLNTRGRCKYNPQVGALCWERDIEKMYPRSVYRYDYILAADVVYHHDFLEELLITMRHFCQPGTTLIWSNKVRFTSDLHFINNFKSTFHTTVLAELPKEEVTIFMATSRE